MGRASGYQPQAMASRPTFDLAVLEAVRVLQHALVEYENTRRALERALSPEGRRLAAQRHTKAATALRQARLELEAALMPDVMP